MIITKGEAECICFEEILELWKKLPTSFPMFLTEIPEEQKQQNENFLTETGEEWKKLAKSFPAEEEEQIWKQRTDTLLEAFLAKEQILGIRSHMSRKLFGEFQEETMKFVQKTRRFDSELSNENIWQAMRNYFIYAVIADLQGQKQECKGSAWAYSLLYPYTDNYIDEKGHTAKQKEAYNKMIHDKLCDLPVTAEKGIGEKTCYLLESLCSEYQGEKRREIQNLLLLMLEAQSNSIHQQCKKKKLTEEEILRISVYKGSISVLIDYFFTVARMEQEEIEFYMKFGFLLQLADDLQDVKEDKKCGSQTIIVRYAKQGRMEDIVNCLLHYAHQIFAEFTPVKDSLKAFMEQNCYTMLLLAAAQNKSYLSKTYIQELEKFLPVHIAYLQKQKQLQKRRKRKMPAGGVK